MRADRHSFDPNLAVQIATHTGHTCRMCGGGCRSYDVILTEREARRLDSAWWRPLLNNVPDDAPLVRLDSASSQYTLNRVDDRCVFLDADNLCIVHKAAGADAKPIACQIFPLHAVQAPDGLHLSLNVSCRRLVEMTDADDPLDAEQGRRLLAQTQAIVTIGETLALTAEIEITYEEFVERQAELLVLLTGPVTNWSDVFDRWQAAVHCLLTIPGADLPPNLDGLALFRTLSTLTEHTQTIRSTLSALYRRTEPGLRALIVNAESGGLFPSATNLQDMPPRFCAQISRQWLEGHQSALHRTARTGWVALLAALVCGTHGAIERSAGGQRPDHALNEAIADAIDLFLSPAGQLALTEPNQQAFLRAFAHD
ncbi:MAG: YkgJ family cysteine cluster protein [Aggregatilineales bacterium]